MTDKQGVPDNVASRVEDFHRSLSDLQTTLQPVLNQLKDIHKKASQDFESQANLDLTLCLVVNSLYWMNQVANGKDPKDGDIRVELARIKKYMHRVVEIKSRKSRMKLDKFAAKAMVRGALFDPKLVETIQTAQLLSKLKNPCAKKQKRP